MYRRGTEYGVRGKMLRIQLPSNYVTVGEGVAVCWVCSRSPEGSPENFEMAKMAKMRGRPGPGSQLDIKYLTAGCGNDFICKFLQIVQILFKSIDQ